MNFLSMLHTCFTLIFYFLIQLFQQILAQNSLIVQNKKLKTKL